MRAIQNAQMQIGEVDISKIKFDPKSRDDIPKILRGLQHLYVNLELREQIFALLEKEIAPKVDKRNGRPGMALWKILALRGFPTEVFPLFGVVPAAWNRGTRGYPRC